MATGTIILWPGPLTLPDGTTNNLFCQAQVVKSTGTEPTNAPDVYFTELLFDGTSDEHALFTFVLPGDYASGGTVVIHWKRASGTGAANVVWKSAIAAITPGGTEVPNSKIFNTVSTATTAAGTTSQALQTTSITPASDSAAAEDMITVMVGRDADNASDTLNAVDAQVTGVYFTYTTT